MKQNWKKCAAVVAMVLIGLICGFVPRVQAAVYLKPLSAGETRSTQDGASWATAYTDAATAISAAQSASDSTLYAAAGVYVIKAKITLSKDLKVYGGFAGTDGETIENRDFSSNETIFSGDVNGDDVWVHYVLDKSQIAKGGSAVTVTTTTSPIVRDGKFSAPPPYSDDYDIYAPVSAKKDTVAKDNTEYFVEAQKTVTELIFSGVTFTGFYSTANSQGNVINGNAMLATAKTTLEDCRFVGNASAEALVYPGGSTLTAKNLTFAYCFAHRSSGIYLNGASTVTDCTFESIYGNYWIRPNAIYMYVGAGQKVVEGCTFTRLAKVASVNASMGGPAVVFSAQSSTGNHAIRNCVVTNCYSIATDYATGAIPIVSPNCARWWFEGCRFSKNYVASATKTDGIYTLFGTQRDTAAGSVLWRDCVFDENVHVVWKTSAPASRSYAFGIAGSATGSAGSYEATFVNCVFDRNEASEVAAFGATVTRGEVLSATANGYAMRTSVANCTFRQKGGDAGFAAVARCGTAHTTPLNVVNTLVMSEGVIATPFAAPEGVGAAKGICAYNVTAQNVTVVPKCVAKAEGWQLDATPFEVSAAGVLTPSVRTPGIRETADVECYDAGLVDGAGKVTTTMPEYRFKVGTSWQGLNVASVTAKEATLIGDITSAAARPTGAFTRGAVQVLGDAAENGKALVIRCEPLQGGGTLTGPSAQAVASGDAAQEVTAVAEDGATFSGWYTTGGTLYSESAALSVSSLDADLVLVAKFSTAQVEITFALGAGGTFTEGGKSTITIRKSVGDVFPEVPAYVGAADWIVTGFSPEMPSVVPSANATYTAELLTTASRVFHIVPAGEVPEGSDGTGSSWANATDDIAAAIQDAGRYRGELWLKEGVYVVPATPWEILSNVGIYGGFAGTETARSEADAKAHVTVLTGDVGQDDYWKPNNTEPATKDKMVFDYANRKFLPPEEEEGVYSMAAVNGTTRGYAFQASDSGIATNSVFSGLTFVRLTMWVLRCTSDAIGSQLTVEDCAFYACGTEGRGSGCIDCYGAVTVKNCTFVQGHGGIVVEDCALGGPSLIEGCTFEGCRARMNYIVSMNNSAAGATMKECVFRRNCLSETKITLVNFRSSPSSTLEDSRFEGNYFLRLNDQTEVVQGALTVPGAKILRCVFIGNTNATHMAKGDYAAVFYQNANANTLVRDSYFADNAMLVTNASSAANAASIAVVLSGTMTFLNCTVADNVAKAAASGYASTAALYASNQNGGLAAVNSVFADNVIEGGTGSAELVRTMSFANNYYGMAAVNSIFYNEAEGYKPIYLKTSGQPMIIVSSYLSNVKADGSGYAFSGNFATYGVWRDVVAEGVPGLRDVKTDATTGVKAMGVTKGSALAKSGVPVYLASDGFVYIYDDVSTVSGTKPWRRVVSPQQGIYASVTGLTKDAGLVADAFGQARVVGKVAAGPLNAPTGGFVLIIR